MYRVPPLVKTTLEMKSSSLSTIRGTVVHNNLSFRYVTQVMESSSNETRGSKGDDSQDTAQNSSRRNRTHGTAKRIISTTNSSSVDGDARNSNNFTVRKSDGVYGTEKGRAEFLFGDNHVHGTNNKSKVRAQSRKSTSTTLKIETSNFQSSFHKNMVRAAKYKVHAPNCTCRKVKTIRERYMGSRLSKPRQQNSGQFELTAESTSAASSSYNETVLFGTDGTISQQFVKMLQVSEPERTADTTKQVFIDSDSIFDNLIVLPDTQSPSAVYICKDTDSKKFAENGMACEQKLSIEIFGSNVDSTLSGIGDWPSFKVSCAICLLTSHHRNGFVAMVSDSLDRLQPFVQRARIAAKSNQEKGLHSDHAHFVCPLEIPSLQSLLQSGKTRSAVLQSKKHILIQMDDAGVKLSTDVNSFIRSGGEVIEQGVDILLGHHLSSLLHIMANQCPKNLLLGSSAQSRQLQYIMVIGYQDGPFKWTLDLPGGKRHLGESTLEGAIREVEEECSLLLDRKWMEGLVPLKYGGGADSYDSSNESLRETTGDFACVFETSGDAFIVMIPSS